MERGDAVAQELNVNVGAAVLARDARRLVVDRLPSACTMP